MVKINPMTTEIIETTICHVSGPNGMRAGITIGAVKGMMDAQIARLLSGSWIADIIMKMEMTIGMEMKTVSDCESPSSLVAEPSAA